jgi:hypothetical protein
MTSSSVTAVLDAIYGDEPKKAYMPDEIGAAKRLMRNWNLTPSRARHLMDFCRREGRFAYVRTALNLEKFYRAVAEACDASRSRSGEHRPYDHKPAPELPPSRPEELFPRCNFAKTPGGQEMLAARDNWEALVRDAESRGFRGMELAREVRRMRAEQTGDSPTKGLVGAIGRVPPAKPKTVPQVSTHRPPPRIDDDAQEGFDLARVRADLEAQAAALDGGPPSPESDAEHARLCGLISWCVTHPEAGREEFRRANVASRVIPVAA